MIPTPTPTLSNEDISPDNLATLLIELLLCIYRENLKLFP